MGCSNQKELKMQQEIETIKDLLVHIANRALSKAEEIGSELGKGQWGSSQTTSVENLLSHLEACVKHAQKTTDGIKNMQEIQ